MTHDIYTETPLAPSVIADVVTRECASSLGSCVPYSYADALENRAVTCYRANGAFRTAMRKRGDAGRATLYAFMRHWLAAHLKADRPDLFRALPEFYCVGAPLPAVYFKPKGSK